MVEFITRYWLEVVFSACIALLSFGYRKLAARMKKQQSVCSGVEALLRDRIVQAYSHYADKGFCPIYARENIENMFMQYTALGGNGTVKDLVMRINNLPTEKIEKKEIE